MDADQRITNQEVIDALERGVSIWGASSMGALLAVQLQHEDGIRGHGRVFETLRALKQHDERLPLEELIMALYTREHFERLTIPLIEPIAYCQGLGCGIEDLARLGRAFCDIPLEARSWSHFRNVAKNEGVILPATPPSTNSKYRDARELLDIVREAQAVR